MGSFFVPPLPPMAFISISNTRLKLIMWLERRNFEVPFFRNKEVFDLTNLHHLPKGGSATVVSLTAEGITRRRLLDLGFTEGSIVKTIRKSPLGDPTAYLIRGSVIALRKEEAAQIKIDLENSPCPPSPQ